MSTNNSELNAHYAPAHSEAAIHLALATMSPDKNPMGNDDLAGLDQLHTGGIAVTRELAQHAAITAADRVLDVGGGIGGPARVLAKEFGCQVTVLDLTEAYCRIGEQLTAQANLTEYVHFQQGDALAIPFTDGSFDVVWTQHSSMNIADKVSLYQQIHRVLRLGGRLAFQEVVSGTGEPIHLPTMWTHTESMNFLMSPEALHTTLISLGFRELAWNDITQSAMSFFQNNQQPTTTASNPLGLQLLLGNDMRTMLRNHILNLQEGRIRIIEGILERM